MISFCFAISAILLLFISPNVEGKSHTPYFSIGQTYGIRDSNDLFAVIYDPFRKFHFRGKKQLALKFCMHIAAGY